jgi:hypothetical protein
MKALGFQPALRGSAESSQASSSLYSQVNYPLFSMSTDNGLTCPGIDTCNWLIIACANTVGQGGTPRLSFYELHYRWFLVSSARATYEPLVEGVLSPPGAVIRESNPTTSHPTRLSFYGLTHLHVIFGWKANSSGSKWICCGTRGRRKTPV